MIQNAESPPYLYVRSPESLRECVKAVKSSERVALDTEADSLHHYYEKVCLIQLSVNDQHFIVDPLAKIRLDEFLETLSKKPLILHGADYDLRMLYQSFKFKPRKMVFDTMIAAQILGYEKFGLANLVEHFFKVKLSKDAQRADWSRRPLSSALLDYARDDTRYLTTLADCLKLEMEAKGRLRWHEEFCERLMRLCYQEKQVDEDSRWRVKGAGILKPRELNMLKHLWLWRDQEAQRVDCPVFLIMTNQKLIEISKFLTHPSRKGEAELPKLPSHCKGKRLQALKRAIESARKVKSEEWPRQKRRERTLKGDFKPQVTELREACVAIAEKLSIPSPMIAPLATLRLIAAHEASTVEEMMACSPILKWQAELLEPRAKTIMKKMAKEKGKK